MKLLFKILVLVFLTGNAFSQMDSTIVAPKKKYNTKWRVAAHANYINFNNSLGYFDIDSEYKLGFSTGPVFNFNISPFYSMRLEPYYLFQQIQNRYVADNVDAKTSFTNHVAGMDFFPVVLKTNTKFKPTLSLGGYAQYHIHSKSQTEINGTEIAYPFDEFNQFQAGWIVGAGVYLKRTLLELRLYNALVEFYPNATTSNTLRSMSFIIAF
ncbi:PorT family protein [Cyclobacteriaceae bacterium YHN15]|nr:PorT family protein [Cyclobacteriaceae bacterium YHN15]